MTVYQMKLPDVGEGVAEAEIVEWFVAAGDEVTPDSVIAEVLTDKATVEVSPPVTGTVVALYGEPGDVLAVGTNLIDIETTDHGPPEQEVAVPVDPSAELEPAVAAESSAEPPRTPEPTAADAAEPTTRVAAAPAVRRRADELGIDLAGVTGSGPEGRIVHSDLDRLLTRDASPLVRRSGGGTGADPDDTSIVQVRGVRRKIAERLSATWSEIPHITYVEAVDVTELEALRTELNAAADGRARVTMLPFIVRAIVVGCRDQPEMNAHYDHTAGTLTVHRGVNVGIATQTHQGLMVPVLRRAESMELRDAATEISRITAAARDGSVSRDELSGSTITITSLGAIGGIVTTPILNAPEVAIIGVNRIEVRAIWDNGGFQPRKMVNLSSSFDHRMIDGWDAARFVQRLRSLLENPALLFVD